MSDAMLLGLAAAGGLRNVREVNVKGCREVKDWEALARCVPRLERLNASWSGVQSLPLCGAEQDQDDAECDEWAADDSGFFDLDLDLDDTAQTDLRVQTPSRKAGAPLCRPFANLRQLSLSSTPALDATTLAAFLAHLPPTLDSLDLSHIGLLPSTLAELVGVSTSPIPTAGRRQTGGAREEQQPQLSLAELDLSGNDALTLSDIRPLEHAWRCKMGDGRRLRVVHTAVLESDEEDDVRRFVELVAGASVVGR